MNFSLFWVDFYWDDRLFGFGLCSYKTEETVRSLLAIYWAETFLIDLFWIRIKDY